jgi:hypothetical protein
MSTPLTNHRSTAIVGYSVRIYQHHSDLIGESSILAELKGGRRWAQPYRRVEIMFDRFRLEPEVCGIYKRKDTMVLKDLSFKS